MSEAQRHRSSLKQQNKPFKGKSKPAKNKSGRSVPTSSHVSALLEHSKQDRKNAAIQKRKHQRESLLSKSRSFTSSSHLTVSVLSMHHDAVPLEISNSSMSFLPVPRSEIAVLDYGKISDCFILLFSCENADLSNIKLDPSSSCAFDETGYKLLSALKAQGFPPVIGVLQGLESVPQKRQKEVKKLYSRYFLSEVPEGGKLRPASKLSEILHDIQVACRTAEELQFRSFRAYLHAEKVNHEVGFSDFIGVVKGSGLLNANQLVHITGVGDFNIHSIIKQDGSTFLPDNPENITCEKDPGPFAAEQTWPNEDDLTEAFSRLEVKTDHPADMLDDEEDEGLNLIEEEKQVFEFEERKKEDFDFPDEVNTPHDQMAKIRFQKFRGLASFRTSEWDKYENLPPDYSKIYEFKEPGHIVKQDSLEKVRNTGQTAFGEMVCVRIAGFPKEKLSAELPVIVSSLLPQERKLSVLHFRLERYQNNELSLDSKEQFCLNYGFRRVLCNPVFSEDTNGDKHKYLRTVPTSGLFIASIYAPVSFCPSNALLYKDQIEGPGLVATGSLLSFDPGRLIIKRILLTGYPLKIHKRKAVIRYMFLNPTDIRYFKPIELFTKSGLRGHIKESLGTHGHMKCVFNDFIKHGDIVCLPLYKRVFPRWDPRVWN